MADAGTNSRKHSPVWNVYDEYRTARLNVRYREWQLDALQKKNFIIELIIAISVSSGAAGLWFWQTNIGDIVWKSFVSVAALISIIKPLVKYPDQIKQKSELLSKWRLIDSQLKLLIIEIKDCKTYSRDLQDRFHALIKAEETIEENAPAEAVDDKLINKCFDRVNQELPLKGFYVPEDKSDAR
jgi:hypothetical protein